MARLTPEQAHAITRGAEVDTLLREKRKDITTRVAAAVKEAVEKEMRGQVQELIDERNWWAFQAKKLGAPVSQISEKLMHTTHRDDAYAAIRAGEMVDPPASSVQAAPEAPAPIVELHPEFRIDGDVVTVTPTEEELLAILSAVNLEAADLIRHPELRTAQFRIDDEGRALPITAGFIEGLSAQHPAVVLARSDQPLGKRLRAFVESELLATAA